MDFFFFQVIASSSVRQSVSDIQPKAVSLLYGNPPPGQVDN